MAVVIDGALWALGMGHDCQLGLGGLVPVRVVVVEEFMGSKVLMVACIEVSHRGSDD